MSFLSDFQVDPSKSLSSHFGVTAIVLDLGSVAAVPAHNSKSVAMRVDIATGHAIV